MPDRKRKIKLIYVVLVAGIFVIAGACLYMNTDGIIIQYGIRTYRRLRTSLMAVGGILSLAVLVLYCIDLGRYKKWQKAQAAERARAEAEREKLSREKEKHREVLSVSKKMDSLKIRELLTEYAAQKWNVLAQPLMQIRLQLDIMDEHQEKLSHLLDANGADALANTEDILDRVEQYLCKNVRKVLNYMDVADNDSPGDVQMVRGKLQTCHEEGQKQLQQVQEFLFALAEFLNKQGENDNSMEMLDIYKSTILQSIDEEKQ